jgi:hypothetical protein
MAVHWAALWAADLDGGGVVSRAVSRVVSRAGHLEVRKVDSLAASTERQRETLRLERRRAEWRDSLMAELRGVLTRLERAARSAVHSRLMIQRKEIPRDLQSAFARWETAKEPLTEQTTAPQMASLTAEDSAPQGSVMATRKVVSRGMMTAADWVVWRFDKKAGLKAVQRVGRSAVEWVENSDLRMAATKALLTVDSIV